MNKNTYIDTIVDVINSEWDELDSGQEQLLLLPIIMKLKEKYNISIEDFKDELFNVT